MQSVRLFGVMLMLAMMVFVAIGCGEKTIQGTGNGAGQPLDSGNGQVGREGGASRGTERG